MSAPSVSPSESWRGVSLCALGLSLWHERGLPASWRDAPYDSGGMIAFLLWMAIVLLPVARRGWHPRPLVVPAALFAVAFGSILETHFLVQGGFALLLLAQARRDPGEWVAGLAAAAAWMPATGWILARLFPPAMAWPFRIGVAVLALSLILARHRQPRVRAPEVTA